VPVVPVVVFVCWQRFASRSLRAEEIYTPKAAAPTPTSLSYILLQYRLSIRAPSSDHLRKRV